MFLFRCKTELASTESNLISFIFQHQQTTNFCNKKKIRKRFKTTFTKPHPQHPVHPLNQDPIKVYREFTIKVCPPWSSKLAKVRLNRLLHNRKYSLTKTPRLKSPWIQQSAIARRRRRLYCFEKNCKHVILCLKPIFLKNVALCRILWHNSSRRKFLTRRLPK